VTQHAPKQVRLRPATEHDLPGIHAIEVATFADAWSLTGFRDLLDHPHALLEVAESDAGELLGYAAAWFVADESEIANLAVAERARRRGVASLLLDRVLAEARSFGARSVFLEVRESNEAGRKLYESRGFAASGRRKLYYRKPDEDALIMRRALS
jgi:[ribosomal protein S18]-alanine N-acetyltransferase